MILVRLTGGLGNQMFQYAFGKALALQKNIPLKLDISLLGENEKVDKLVVRHFDLDAFELHAEFATADEVEKFNGKPEPGMMDRVMFQLNKMRGKYPLMIQKDHELSLDIAAAIGENACLVGRWQSELYFKGNEAELKKEFRFNKFVPNEFSGKVGSDMERGVSVALHVRRGDYVTHPVYSKSLGALTRDYYTEAIRLIREKLPDNSLKFYFISDDIRWCRETFSGLEDAFFVEQPKDRLGYFSDLWLLTKASHCIISNSTFSWWGAWLGEKTNGIVVAPANWAREASHRPPFIIPDRWIKLNNSFDNL